MNEAHYRGKQIMRNFACSCFCNPFQLWQCFIHRPYNAFFPLPHKWKPFEIGGITGRVIWTHAIERMLPIGCYACSYSVTPRTPLALHLVSQMSWRRLLCYCSLATTSCLFCVLYHNLIHVSNVPRVITHDDMAA